MSSRIVGPGRNPALMARDARNGRAAPLGTADWLSLAAAPAFALMALLTGVPGDSALDLLCSGGGFWPGGMAPMYGLMAAVHLAPWLRLAARWRNGAG